MTDIIKIKKGLDIPLSGAVETTEVRLLSASMCGICPEDYPGYSWKLAVKEGDAVSCGATLMTAKENPQIALCSPVGGKVAEVRRGDRRKILAVVVAAEGDQMPVTLSADKPLIELLCESGLWAMMRQRPFDVVPDPQVRPRDIFITAFDSSPLAGDMLTADDLPALAEGVAALQPLTDGKVYLGVRFGSGISVPDAVVTEYQGPHPAGNVGVQIASLRPVNKGETVWALDARTVARIGRLVRDGHADFSTRVAVTGSEVKRPETVLTRCGAALKPLLDGQLRQTADIRVISGNVLTGIRESLADGFLRYPYRQVTVIPDGEDKEEFMGWASLKPDRYSVKRTFPTFLHGLKNPFSFDSRLKGGRRAMILSGEYDKVFPFDIYPEFLIKAAMAHNIDKMEGLGIYEVVPEDFALPEFVDSSNIPLQEIIREAQDYLRKEL